MGERNKKHCEDKKRKRNLSKFDENPIELIKIPRILSLPVLFCSTISEILEFRWLSLINGIILAKTMKTWNEELNFLDIIAINCFHQI